MIDMDGVMVRFPRSYERNVTIRARVAALKRQLMTTGRLRREKEYFYALTEVDLLVREGDVVGVIGPNGSGKSTLLRTIAGIYEPDSGTVSVHGAISMLLSLGTGLNNNLSGRHNIYMVGHVMGLSREKIDANIDDIIDYAELGEYIDVPVRYYSSGMISRLGFSIAASMEPDILLVDEVFAVGDLAFRRKSEKTLQRLLDHAQCQIIVTHNLDFVRDSCNRAIYVNSGRLVADGSPEEVVGRYRADVERETAAES